MLKLPDVRALLLAAVCSLALPALADDAKQAINIPEGELRPALDLLARQSGVGIVYRPEQVRGLKTHGAHGRLTTEEAVTRLLQGTDLTFRTDPTGAMLIASPGSGDLSSTEKASSQADEAAPKEGKKSSPGEFRTAQLGQGTNSETLAVGSNASASQQHEVELEEVVVTAQKRAERLIDVPISIVALTADEIQKRQITDIDELSMAVPGLTFRSDGGYGRTIVLRGTSNFFGNASLIGLYLDEAPVTSNSAFQLDLRTYDLDRIEVLRGPQGTLYGEGSVGGTIRFITKSPLLDRFTFDADAAALFTEDGAPGQRVEAAVNVPLINDQLAVRVAGTFDHEGGWIDQPSADRKDINGEDLTDVRVKALWKPTMQFTADAMAVIHRNDAGVNRGEDAEGNFTQVLNLSTTPRVQDNYNIFNLTLNYDFTAFRILSTSSLLDQDKAAVDIGTAGHYLPPPLPALDVYFDESDKNRTFTQELRISSLGSGPWQWTLGGFYRRARFTQFEPFVYFGLPGPAGTPLPPPQTNVLVLGYLTKSYAAFGDSSYKLTDRFTLGVGLRYFQDDQVDEDGSAQTARFHSLDPRLYAQYKLTERANVYASASKGFRSGGFNALNQPAYQPENVWTYEVGTKFVALDNRLSADAAVFYSDYKDYQIVGLLPPPAPQTVAITGNAGDAWIRGVEGSITWHPVKEWTLSFNGDYLGTRFYKIDANSAAQNVGDSLNLIPKYQYTVSIQQDFTWLGRNGFARLDYNEQGREIYRNRAIGPWFYGESDLIHMLNFNTSLQWNEQLSMGVFAQNLTNDRKLTDPTNIQGTATRPRPRTVGIQFSVKFD